MRKEFVVSALVLLLSVFSGQEACAQAVRVMLDDSDEKYDVTTEVIQSDVSVHKAKITIHAVRDAVLTENGGEYHVVEMYGNQGSEVSKLFYDGEPQLPIVYQTIAIPEGATCKISVTEGKWQDMEIGTIYPAQILVKERDPEPPFVFKEDVYQQEVYAPFLVKMGTEWNYCNIRSNTVCVCPFKYYPLQNKLSVLTEFTLQIDFIGVADASMIRPRDLNDAIKDHMYDNDISGFPVMSDMAKSVNSDNYDYLIIVGNNSSILNSQALKDFRKWKAFKGYKTKVVSTTAIGTGTTANDIKSYISQEYTLNGIKNVLLVGDQDVIPIKILYGLVNNDTVKSDYWYGCLVGGENDYNAEIPIGRFSTNSLAEFENMVAKTIDYEKSFGDDFQNILLAAHKEDAPNKYQGCCEEIRTAHNSYLSFYKAYGASSAAGVGGNNATNADVVSYINSGKHIVNYRGHGEPTHWGIDTLLPTNKRWNVHNELFESSQINNISRKSIFFNVCCLTGDITEEPCFMETFMRSSKGAIACLAATEEIYTSPAHVFDKFLFTKLLNDNKHFLGRLNVDAHVKSISYYTGSPHYAELASFNALAFLCGGDPTLEIWTGTPNTYSTPTLSSQAGGFVISSPSFNTNDTICVVDGSGNLTNRFAATGTSTSFSAPSGDFYVAVNRHNFYPYTAHYHTSNYIQNETIDVNNYIASAPLNIGYDVNTAVPYGNVTVKSGSKLSISNGTDGVNITKGFECELGAELTIQ